MNRTDDVRTLAAPSLARLIKTTIAALVAAGIILAAFVLPAEYAIDPLGTGRLLGLTRIAAPPLAPADVPPADGVALAPVMRGPIGEYPGGFKLDVFTIELAPYEYVEYKYRLEKGATMLYSWTATGGVVHDFHGERASTADGGPSEESFDKQDRRQASASFSAPFSGIHGWYWENPSGEPIKIQLTSAGFYTSAVEIRSDRSRRTPPLRTLDSLSSSTPNSGDTK